MTDKLMQNDEAFKLTNDERHSAVWKKIKDHISARIAENRRKNDCDLSQEDTAKVRGRIAELLYLESLGIEDEPEKFADSDE